MQRRHLVQRRRCAHVRPGLAQEKNHLRVTPERRKVQRRRLGLVVRAVRVHAAVLQKRLHHGHVAVLHSLDELRPTQGAVHDRLLHLAPLADLRHGEVVVVVGGGRRRGRYLVTRTPPFEDTPRKINPNSGRRIMSASFSSSTACVRREAGWLAKLPATVFVSVAITDDVRNTELAHRCRG